MRFKKIKETQIYKEPSKEGDKNQEEKSRRQKLRRRHKSSRRQKSKRQKSRDVIKTEMSLKLECNKN